MPEPDGQDNAIHNVILHALLTRRSVKAVKLVEPGPDEAAIRQIMTAAMRVPDHGKLAPWRLVLLDKQEQARLGARCAERFAVLHPDATDKQIAHERQRPQRAPLLVAVLYCPALGRIPEWEQQLSTGAVCMNLLHAAHALGYAGQWLTEWIAYDEDIARFLGATGEQERIAGFIYLGTPAETPEERTRPDYDRVVRCPARV